MSAQKYGYLVQRPGKGRKAADEEDRRAFAKRLRALLDTLGFDVPEFARRVGMDPRSPAQLKAVRSWIAHNAPVIPDPSHFMRICRGINASPTYLLFGVGPQLLDAPQPRSDFAEELKQMVIQELRARDRHDPQLIDDEVAGDGDLLKRLVDVYDLRLQFHQIAAVLGLSPSDQRFIARQIEVMVVREDAPAGRRISAIQAVTNALRQYRAMHGSLDGFDPASVLESEDTNGLVGRDGRVPSKSTQKSPKRKTTRRRST